MSLHCEFSERIELEPLVNTERYAMYPPLDGSLGVEQVIHQGIASSAEMTIRQAVRAAEVGAPEKDGCGDAAVVTFSTFVDRQSGEPLCDATLVDLQDFLSAGGEDKPIVDFIRADLKTKAEAAEMVGIGDTSGFNPDTAAAEHFRARGARLMHGLAHPDTMGFSPFSQMIVSAFVPQHREIFKQYHRLGIGLTSQLTLPAHALYSLPNRIERLEAVDYEKMNSWFAAARRNFEFKRKTRFSFSPGFGGSVRSIAMVVDVFPKMFETYFKHVLSPEPRKLLFILRSNADQPMRITINDGPPYYFMENNNAIADELLRRSGGGAGYDFKPNLYWMSGTNRSQSSKTDINARMGLPLFTMDLIPLKPTDTVKIEQISDGMLLHNTSRVYVPEIYGDVLNEKSVLEQYLRGELSDARLLSQLKFRSDMQWLPQDASVFDAVCALSPQQYVRYLRLKQLLKESGATANRPDDATAMVAMIRPR